MTIPTTGIQSTSSVQMGSADQVDLQTLMMSVMIQRSELLDGQVRSQADAIQQKNNTLKNINNLLSEASVNQAKAAALDGANQLSATEANGLITIKISDEYTLEVPKPNTDMSWTLKDKEGNKVRIWGDPHVDENADGTTDWDFKQNSTFMLADGTKISVGTTPWSGNPDMTVTSSLTITRGDEVVTVNGIDNNNVTYTDSNTGGRAIDAKTNDGYIFREGAGGVDDWTATDASGNQVEIRSDQAMGTVLQNELALETNDVEMSQAMKDFLAANPKLYTDSDGDGKLTAAEYKTLIDNLGRERDTLTSTSQLEMTMLQATMNKYNQTYEALSNFTSKYFQSLNTITGNMR